MNLIHVKPRGCFCPQASCPVSLFNSTLNNAWILFEPLGKLDFSSRCLAPLWPTAVLLGQAKMVCYGHAKAGWQGRFKTRMTLLGRLTSIGDRRDWRQ